MVVAFAVVVAVAVGADCAGDVVVLVVVDDLNTSRWWSRRPCRGRPS